MSYFGVSYGVNASMDITHNNQYIMSTDQDNSTLMATTQPTLGVPTNKINKSSTLSDINIDRCDQDAMVIDQHSHNPHSMIDQALPNLATTSITHNDGEVNSNKSNQNVDMMARIEERRDLRPCYKLSVRLIETYKNVNAIYYENKKKKTKEKHLTETNAGVESSSGDKAGPNNDGYDDANFNYILRDGKAEVFDDRYVYKHKIGSGSFGQVVCAHDRITDEDVAIKIIKSKKPFLMQAQTEIELLGVVTRIQEEEQTDYNCISLVDTFMHHNHQCLVFEMLSYNLYDLLRNSRFKGVSFGLVRKFGKQILVALSFLGRSDVDIIHCDLKPENILLRNPKRSAIKIIDFGSSCKRSMKPYTYIQSRFYRSPEVLLCLGYDQKIDIWSLGCVLVEMHTGEPLFGGKDQLDQLFRIVTMFGMPPVELIERSPQTTRNIFFEKVPVSRYRQEFPNDCDPTKLILSSDQTAYYVMKKPKSFAVLPATRTLDQVLGVYDGGPGGRRRGEPMHETVHYLQFADLIRCLLKYDPQQRLSAENALQHPFFATGMPVNASNSPLSGAEANRPGSQLTSTLMPSVMGETMQPTTSSTYHPFVNKSEKIETSVNVVEPYMEGDTMESAMVPRLRAMSEDLKIRSRSAPSSATSGHSMRLRSSQGHS